MKREERKKRKIGNKEKEAKTKDRGDIEVTRVKQVQKGR
jgi:hypothetical protein